MTVERLPPAVTNLYAELLDQLQAAERLTLGVSANGSFVSKNIKGRNYWYFQKIEAEKKTQTYLGPESPELLKDIAAAKANRASLLSDARRRRELVSMLLAGGATPTAASLTRILQLFADTFVFRMGGVLIGTHAFACYSNMLGVRFESRTLQTADIDIAQDRSISIGIAREGDVDLPRRLREVEPRMSEVPGIDPRDPSTSFMARGRDVRVDFLTPALRSHTRPVFLPHLRVAAQPIAGLDYLIEKTARAAVVSGSGVLVSVPLPARYAMRKLWVSAARHVTEHAKAEKDMLQATQMIEALLESRPGDLDEAVAALKTRARMWKRVEPVFKRLTG